MQRLGRLMMLFVVGILTLTCARITVNIYFPAAEIRDAATEIEREVRQGDKQPETPASKPQGLRLWPRTWHVRLSLGVPETAAQQIDINITTPEIRRLIASRKQRYTTLKPLFDQGALGENNQGLVEIRSLEGLSLRDKARIKALHDQENSDRQQLYEALAEANNIPKDQVQKIATIFAEVNRREALAGWWIQETNNSWRKK